MAGPELALSETEGMALRLGSGLGAMPTPRRHVFLAGLACLRKAVDMAPKQSVSQEDAWQYWRLTE